MSDPPLPPINDLHPLIDEPDVTLKNCLSSADDTRTVNRTLIQSATLGLCDEVSVGPLVVSWWNCGVEVLW